MKLTPLIAALTAGSFLAGAAHADMDYHGFDKETVDALNERLETPLSSEALSVLSQHRGLEACGGSKSVDRQAPEGWAERVETANPPGGDVAMPVPDAALAPDYPPLLNALGVDGACQVMFDVNDDGTTSDIMASCTLPAFADATEQMIRPLEFSAAPEQSSPATDDIIIPVQYCAPREEEG